MIQGVHHPLEILYGGGVALSCGADAEVRADALHGLFAGDTRVLSTYRFTLAGYSWQVLSRSRSGPSAAQWDLQNPKLRAPGGDLDEGLLHFRVRRNVMGALHDDLSITSFAERSIVLRFSIQIDADFADLFQVKAGSTPPRLGTTRAPGSNALSLIYERKGFQRGLHVSFSSNAGAPTHVGAQVVFDLALQPGQSWRVQVEAAPELDGHRLRYQPELSIPDESALDELGRARANVTLVSAPLLAEPFERGHMDLRRLALRHEGGAPFIAAGAPWFLALFGRDTLVTSLMAALIGSWHVEGALQALAATQATVRDDFRDAEPGKIAHELRQGELARFHAVPHTPYYGTHDAPALFVLALWNAFRWTGRRALLDAHLETARRALRWCDEAGDSDGDGLLEYQTHSSRGYRNQGWKDAGDAIVHEDGRHACLPIATVELQAYWYAARLAMAELLDVSGHHDQAQALREAARQLRRRIEERFWMEEEGCYALALDGDKRLVRTIASNAGQLLWCGVPSRDRALRVARRLLAEDMFSGYGLRSLSAEHPRYNPLSYQRGSVWPHDSAIFAAGLARYGLHQQGARVIQGVLDAAATFEQSRLPELFCGFPRAEGAPVPYLQSNVPQAWAAAAPILATQIFAGLVPDVVHGRCYLKPWLPEWLPELTLRGIEIGEGHLDLQIVRTGGETRIARMSHPTLELLDTERAAPLWGTPIATETVPHEMGWK